MDPRSFKSDQEYAYAEKTAWAFARASEEILEFIEKAKQESEEITKKEKGLTIDKLREGVS